MTEQDNHEEETNNNPASSTVEGSSLAEVRPDAPQAAPKKAQKVVALPTSAIAKLRNEGREKERASLNQRAQALGFKNFDDMFKAQETKREQATSDFESEEADEDSEAETHAAEQPKQSKPKTTQNQNQFQTKTDRERARLLEEKRMLAKKNAIAVRQNRQLQRELDAREAEHELRLAAVRAGINDVDFALYCARQAMQGKSATELESFNENEFFSKTLKQQKPYLYGVVNEPAHTGSVEAPPSLKSVQKDSADKSDKVDVRTMTTAEYEAHLRKRGLNKPGLGVAG